MFWLIMACSTGPQTDSGLPSMGNLDVRFLSGANPVSNAGSDQVVAGASSVVSLDGRASTDPENDPLSYAWTFRSVPAGSTLTSGRITNRFAAQASFTPDVVGSYELRLRVGDGTSYDTDLMVVVVNPVNQAPIANAGPDLNATLGAPLTLDGDASYDPDGDALTYRWGFRVVPAGSALTNASLVDRYTPYASFTPDVEGVYGLRLVVSDGVYSVTDLMDLTVTAAAPGLSGTLSVADRDHHWRSEDSGENLGRELVAAGDLDGDGFDDFVVGVDALPSSMNTTDNGTYVLWGRSGTPDRYIADASSVFTDPEMGSRAAAPGDMDGDGWPDVVLSATALLANSSVGAVYFLYGGARVAGGAADTVLPSLQGSGAGTQLGVELAAVGDLDGDGLMDLGVLQNSNANPGWTLVYGSTSRWSGSQGTTGLPTITTTTSEEFDPSYVAEYGRSLASGGDLDGDGCAELVLGAPGYSGTGTTGRVYLFAGDSARFVGNTPNTAADATIEGLSNTMYHGTLDVGVVVLVQDFDEDGHAELLVSAPFYAANNNTGSGAIFIWSGGLSLPSSGTTADADRRVYGEGTYDILGYPLDAGDLDGDGQPELYTSVRLTSQPNHSRALIGFLGSDLTGTTYASDAFLRIDHDSTDGIVSASAVGDYDGDGFRDLLWADPEYGVEHGRLYLFSGF